jgi:ppGpp synthetase/RelA/SpoT-type nucleotidyltranferase
MNEAELVARFRDEIPILQAWGDYVTATVSKTVETAISPRRLNDFLKIPPKPRVKDVGSLVDKAFYRDKSYTDPYAEITDKVGVRFVVLLTSEIKTVETAITACNDWTAIKDRDYEEERKKYPTAFTYQSVHYVVGSKQAIECDGKTVPAGTPCEIQIRTLLQHAYAELSHTWTYKPKTTVVPIVKRTVAKSMALIETTDEFFEVVVKTLGAEGKPLKDALSGLSQLYGEMTGITPDAGKSNILVLDALREKITGDLLEKIREFFRLKTFVGRRIAERAEYQHLFKQPIILLAYYLVSENPGEAKDVWPLTPDELRPVFDDLGKNFDGF